MNKYKSLLAECRYDTPFYKASERDRQSAYRMAMSNYSGFNVDTDKNLIVSALGRQCKESDKRLITQYLSQCGVPCPACLSAFIGGLAPTPEPQRQLPPPVETKPEPPKVVEVPPPPPPNKPGIICHDYAKSYEGVSTYDISNNLTLSYSRICSICEKQAREKLSNTGSVMTREAMEYEKARRNELMNEIVRYKRCRWINVEFEEDCASMSIHQLETYLKSIQDYHDELKVREVMSGICTVGGRLYDSIFPDGIPITSKKVLKFDGLGEEIINTLISPSTTTGISFNNILRKHNIHISDELCSLTSIAKIILSKCTIEDRKVEPPAEQQDVEK